MIEIRHQQGLHLPELDLWLDPPDSHPQAFVSHAHSDHFARHGRILCSQATAILLRARFRVAAERLEPLPFHQPFELGGFRLRLLPAGHITGSAMLHVSNPRHQDSLLYTGDFKLRRGRTNEAAHLMHAATLVMETTFGLPRFVLPPQLEIEMAVVRFVHDAFRDGVVPVLLAYSLGKAQEVLALLHEHGIPALSHAAVAGMTEACREAGSALPAPMLLESAVPAGHAVVAPPNALGGQPLRSVTPKRSAILTGWALEPGTKWRHRVEEAIPLSDHADHPGLLECVQRVRPKRVLTVHGFAREFAAELRARGIDAWSAAGHDQLELAIQSPAVRAGSAAAQGPALARHPRPVCAFADFSDLRRLVDETHSRVAKRGFIANYLRTLGSNEELRLAMRWLAGEEPWSRPRTTAGLGQATRPPPSEGGPAGLPRPAALATVVRRALLALPGAREERRRELARGQSDPARAARLLLQELPLKPEAAGLTDIDHFLRCFAATAAAHQRATNLAQRLASLHPADAETLLGLLPGGPRPGPDLDLLDRAVAEAFGTSAEEVGRARLLTGSAAESAWLARNGRLAEAAPRPGIALPFMTALTCGEIPDQALGEGAAGESPWWLEPLCLGLRAHLHLHDGNASLLDAAGCRLDHRLAWDDGCPHELECILDGVLTFGPRGNESPPATALGMDPEHPVQGDLFAADEGKPPTKVPHFLAFDLLWAQGEDLTGRSLEERRARLVALPLHEPVVAVPVTRPADRAEAQQALARAVQQGFAGIVCKDPLCPYFPGQPSPRWVAVKARGA